MTFIQIIIIYKTTFILIIIMRETMVTFFHMYSKPILAICHIYNWYQIITQSFIHTRVWFIHSLYIALPLNNPALAYLAPSSCDASGPPQSQVAHKLSPCPPLLPIVPCIPSFWASRNPNVLLIRTHPNPSPSVANSMFKNSFKLVSCLDC